MSSFNKVILVGNITREPETRVTPKGTSVTEVGIAVNRHWKNEAGDKMEEVTFVDVTAFGRTAENMSTYLTKGSSCLVEGRLKLEQWDDKETGAKRSRLKVIVETCQFLGSPKEGGKRPTQEKARPAREKFEGGAAVDEDDVPF